MTVAAALSASLIDDAPQNLEEPRHALDFIQNDQAVFLGFEVEFGVGKFGPVRGKLQIQVNGRDVGFLSEAECQRRLADLTRTQDGDGGKTREQVADSSLGETSDHIAIIPYDGRNTRLCFERRIAGSRTAREARRPALREVQLESRVRTATVSRRWVSTRVGTRPGGTFRHL